MTKHGEFADILALADEAQRPICIRLRELILSVDPEPVEIVWLGYEIASYGVGPKKMTEHYAYISVQKSHVNLGFYHGARLADPAKLLEGTGKSLRHVKITSLQQVENRALKALLKAAVADRQRAKAA